MKLYDITRELFSTAIYPGDPVPAAEPVNEIRKGDAFNLTRITLGTHSGTHMDAPWHFIPEGKTIEEITLEQTIGPCHVVALEGKVTREMLEPVVPKGCERLLIQGEIELTCEGAGYLAEKRLQLLGVEGMNVGSEETCTEIHRTLLGTGMVILENLDMSKAAPGQYVLVAAPLRMKGMDGSPVRAVLMEGENLRLRGLYYSETTGRHRVGALSGLVSEPELLGIRLADQLKAAVEEEEPAR